MRNLTIKHDGIGDSGTDEKGKYAWHDYAVLDEAGEQVAALCLCLTDYDEDQDLGTGDGGWSDLSEDELNSLLSEAAELASANGGCDPQ
jgi:hypothetical protein